MATSPGALLAILALGLIDLLFQRWQHTKDQRMTKQEVKEEIRRENEMIDKYVKEQMGHIEEEPERFDQISEGERSALIAALKDKWDSVNREYQKITHLVVLDTAGQVRRKENFEKEMTQLEADINKLQSRGPLLVKHNQGYY